MFFLKYLTIALMFFFGAAQAESSYGYSADTSSASATARVHISVNVLPITALTKVSQDGDVLKLVVFSNNDKPAKAHFVNPDQACYISDMDIRPQQRVGESNYEVNVPQGCAGYSVWLDYYTI